MYDLPWFKEHNPAVIRDFIARYPFAFVSGCDAQNKPVATQLPVFLEEEENGKFLRGHLMKNTDHHKAFLHNPKVLVVFTGHHCYVSGTWYSNQHTPSTWNYMSVYAEGKVKFLDDEKLIEALRKTSLHFEEYNTQSETIYDNLPVQETAKLMKAIVAFEIKIETMDTVFKLSQNRDQQSYENIIVQLKKQDDNGKVIAHEMEIRKQALFEEKGEEKTAE